MEAASAPCRADLTAGQTWYRRAMNGIRWQLDISLALDTGVGGRGAPSLEALRAEERAVARAVRRLLEEGAAVSVGFWTLPDDEAGLGEASRLVASLPDGLSDVLVLGIGGSSLGARALHEALSDPAAPPDAGARRRLWFPDNSDPWRLAALLRRRLEPAHTLVVAVSKSGGTLETCAQLQVVRAWQQAALTPEAARARLVLVTDPHRGPLRRLAEQEGLAALSVPPAVGGRFSVLSPVGLLPAVLAGHDTEGLLRGAAAMRRACSTPELLDNPAALLAALHVLHARLHGRTIHVLMPYADALRAFAAWWVQLWAESLGKRLDRDGRWVHVGFTPLAAVGATDQHSLLQLLVEGPDDKLVTFVRRRHVEEDLEVPAAPPFPELAGRSLGGILEAEWRATALSLAERGRPSLTLTVGRLDAPHLGALFFLFEAATALAADLMGIDAFDQPGVQRGKVLTAALLGLGENDEARSAVERLGRRLGVHRLGKG